METWRHGDMETWRHGDRRRHGDMETWRQEETWRHGDRRRHEDMRQSHQHVGHCGSCGSEVAVHAPSHAVVVTSTVAAPAPDPVVAAPSPDPAAIAAAAGGTVRRAGCGLGHVARLYAWHEEA